MAQSLPSVTIKFNEWVDLYAATGIAVGTKIIIQNIGSANAKLSESAAQPLPTVGFNEIPVREFFTNTELNVGAWAFSETGTVLQVEEA